MQVHVKEGALKCPGCDRVYPITRGIPNMILTEETEDKK
jgi:multifunctional methyltransferase subunit TRM112